MFKISRLTAITLPFFLVLQMATTQIAFAFQDTQSQEITQHDQLTNAYVAAITHEVMSHWHPDPGLVGACVVEVTQKPGGVVVQAALLPYCRYNDIEKQRMVKAIMDSSPLPYKGFEAAFRAKLDINFVPDSSSSSSTPCHVGPTLKACQKAKIDELFKKLDEAQAQMKAKELAARYVETIGQAVRSQFVRPEFMPQVPCLVKVVQRPGGWVVSAAVDQSCPYDTTSRRAVEGAVLRAQPLPYKGFESVFSPVLEFSFDPKFRGVGK
ncbi:energy transducer TonB [Dyella flagellata]|uniref:Uncharacterized protein n=1 Tax=Dyella flagellata TaxID=1867833 RepID=A0ABQ5X9M3_9GAMM|nr:hypothetical protein [Dyella flagellata]GLQ88295.1 hypothetical protein GCM10007898_18640 [Dyella flagellata]